MRRFFNLFVFIVLLATSFSSGVVFAQEDSPTPTPQEETQTTTGTPTPKPLPGIDAAEEREFLFRDEVYEKLLPAKLQGEFKPKATDKEEREEEGSRLLKRALEPSEFIEKDPTANVSAQKPQGENLFDKFVAFVGSLLNLFTFRAVDKEQGFLHFLRPENLLFTNQKAKEEANVNVFKGAVRDLKSSRVPEEFNPYKYPASFPGSANSVQSAKLRQFFLDAAESQCIPVGMLLAISQRELEATFGFSDGEVEKFSTNNWHAGLNENHPDMKRASCLNTCADPAAKCASGSDVQGPMQFEIETWKPLVGAIQVELEVRYGIKPSDYTPHRCNLRDAIIGAAINMKDAAKPDTSCSNWGIETVYRVAEDYCGSGACAGVSGCGVGYCEDVWATYQTYSNSQ